MSRQKKDARSTQGLLGIGRINDFSIHTRMGDLVFFHIRPTNLSVLPAEGITERVYALLAVLKSMEEVELLALNANESFDGNKAFYRARLEQETEPAVRRLLEQDAQHLDCIQISMASARQFFLVLRLRGHSDTDTLPYLARVEKSIRDCGFRVKRANEQALKRVLALYFTQNVTAAEPDDIDGERWLRKEEEAME